jgi:hypothetical protein
MTALTRVRFAQGEVLRAEDFEVHRCGLELLRSLHVRGAHRTWGVAMGFGVGVGRTRRTLVVGPGFGYDRRGRELVSHSTVLVPAPAEPGAYVLGLARGDCGLDWRWLDPGRVRDELVLCGSSVDPLSGAFDDPDLSVRPGARSSGGRIAAGRYEAPSDVRGSFAVGTEEAGFTRTPFYFVTVTGLDSGDRVESGPLLELESSSATGFTLHARVAPGDGPPPAAKLNVHWVGVEMPDRCNSPDPDPFAVTGPGDPPDEYAEFVPVPSAVEPVPF